MSEQKRFNINDEEVNRCRVRAMEIHNEFAIIGAICGDISLDQTPISEVEKLIALTTELATIRGIQQEHALRCAAEMQVSLDKRRIVQ